MNVAVILIMLSGLSLERDMCRQSLQVVKQQDINPKYEEIQKQQQNCEFCRSFDFKNKNRKNNNTNVRNRIQQPVKSVR